MFGNGFYQPYLYQPYFQAARMANGLGNMANASNLGATGLRGIFSGGKNLLGKFSFSGFLNGASKTLNVVNQAIPIFYQVRPMFHNAKTMFKILGAVKDDKPLTTSPAKDQNNRNDSQVATNTYTSNNIQNDSIHQNPTLENPTFFI